MQIIFPRRSTIIRDIDAKLKQCNAEHCKDSVRCHEPVGIRYRMCIWHSKEKEKESGRNQGWNSKHGNTHQFNNARFEVYPYQLHLIHLAPPVKIRKASSRLVGKTSSPLNSHPCRTNARTTASASAVYRQYRPCSCSTRSIPGSSGNVAAAKRSCFRPTRAL